MPNEIHRKLLVAITDLDFGVSFVELDSLPNGDLAWCAPVTSCEDCDIAEIFYQIKVGTSPTDGGDFRFYVGRGDDGSGEIRAGTDDITTTDHGTEATAADVSRVLGALGPPLKSVRVDGNTDSIYSGSFRVWYPGADFNVYLYNNTGAALNGTSSPHLVRVRGWGPEVQ